MAGYIFFMGNMKYFFYCSTNNPEDYILENTDMPDELIRDVSGEVIFEQTLPYVSHLNCFIY